MIKKISLFSVALLLASYASAQAAAERWTLVQETAKIEYSLKLDLTTARRRGSLIKIWSLVNHKKEADKSRSDTILYELDCDERQFRTLFVKSNSGRDGAGEVVSSASAFSQWTPVVPETSGEMALTLACARVKT